jgi:LmbE family N-acetylglucosaminyl deacetylase
MAPAVMLAKQTRTSAAKREAHGACEALGVDRVEWLPYADSGMAGTETTSNPAAFCNADPHVVASEVVALLANETLTAVVGYDNNGTYGHPDHFQVHAVAHAMAAQNAAHWVLDATYNREYLAKLPGADGTLDPKFAAAEADLTHFVEGEEWLMRKIRAVAHHRSQVPDDWDSENPDFEGFRSRFGTEWFIARAITPDADFSVMTELLQPKATWVSPLT